MVGRRLISTKGDTESDGHRLDQRGHGNDEEEKEEEEQEEGEGEGKGDDPIIMHA